MPEFDDCGCGGNEFPLITVDPGNGGGKPVSVIAGPGIEVVDMSDANEWKFEVSAAPLIDLDVDLTLIAKKAGVAKANPVLKGVVIDAVELDWTTNKDIVSQTLTNNGGLTPPTLLAADRSFDYTGQNITTNISFTLQGNDGLGQPGSIDSDTKQIFFGNNMLLGVEEDFTNGTSGDLTTALAGFSKVVKTSRAHTYFATGAANEHHFVLYPKTYGLATFTKGIFTGGYVRLKLVLGVFKQELGIGDVEVDYMVTNEEGFAEAYYVYMSLYDNQNDAVTPFIIS